ncbi:RDD family protein [Agrococcus jejuensis]|uniref:Uncharacterized membrane protein YckC, RDD family n=1 Tax=Agrococcus jejuensis TaxID=399736 RepID=A0A1G8DYC1_9MICO|nr:RDD family protein [Agrococcus jejuensis]SDH62722.1 Uncharacterized membrane protein YckC, RDD family [Agrococcus jejuensis]
MSEQSREPGWYQDPFGTGPEDRRYWDGDTWLAVQQTQPAAFQAPGAPQQPQPVQPEPQPGYGSTPSDQQDGWPDQPRGFGWGQPASPDDRIRTPDGVELATWGRRFGAYVVDWIVIQLTTLVIAGALGLITAADEAFAPLFAAGAETDPAAASAAVDEAYVGFLTQHSGELIALSFLTLAASGAYHVVLVALRGRTLGKRLMGIRVRLRDAEGLPIWRAALSRWLLHYAVPNLLAGVPGLGLLAGVFPIVDGLWPLWDARRQAIHDKLAKTAVVRG